MNRGRTASAFRHPHTARAWDALTQASRGWTLRLVRFRKPQTPAEVLWRELEDWFVEPDGTSRPGPDLTFAGLEAADVERVWQFLRSSAEPIDSNQTTWDEVDGGDISVVAALERGTIAAAARYPGLFVVLNGVTAHGVKLPWLGLSIYTDMVSFYWWVSDNEGWNRDTAAGLAKLIDDLRRLAPDAQVGLEWDDNGAFFPSIDRFISAQVKTGD